jgi:endonuclease III
LSSCFHELMTIIGCCRLEAHEKTHQKSLICNFFEIVFQVDTNVGRICVRLGWVPLEPLPEELQLHLLEL